MYEVLFALCDKINVSNVLLFFSCEYSRNANYAKMCTVRRILHSQCVYCMKTTLLVLFSNCPVEAGCPGHFLGPVHLYMVKSHEMDSLWGPVCNIEDHIITLFQKYSYLLDYIL